MRAYWWKGRTPNFGDELNGWLLERLDVPFDWAAADESELVMCGSVLEHLPANWTGTVCGAGMLREASRVDLSRANVLAVRGHLTAQHARGVPSSVVLGDPGLLVSRWVPQTVTKYDLGVVPHWSDTELYRRFPYGKLIDVRQPPGDVIRDIARCKRIVSSSLHGIIVADSFSIPRRAELFRQAATEGGDFKFRDYASVFDTHPHFGEFWRAPYNQVEKIRNQLRGVLAQATGTPRPLAEVDPPPDIPHRKGRRPQISILVPYRRDNEDTEHRNRLWDWLSQYWQVNLPQAEIIVGHDGAWPYCADTETQVLTASGWKSYDALQLSEQVLTLNHTTGLSEWQPLQAINVFDVVDEPMLHCEGQSHSSFTTMNHRWPVIRTAGNGIRKKPNYKQQISPADRDKLIVELRNQGWSFDRIGEHIGIFGSSAWLRYQRIKRGRTPREQRGGRGWATSGILTGSDRVPISAQCTDLPIEPKYTDAFVEVVAWAWTEGTFGKTDTGGIEITQSHKVNPANCERIRAALTILAGPPVVKVNLNSPQWREYDDGSNARFYLGCKIGQTIRSVAPRRVPTFAFIRSLTKSQLELFIKISMLADGSESIQATGAKIKCLAQKSKASAEAFQFACILAGYSTSIRQTSVNKYGYAMTNVHLRTARTVCLKGQKVCDTIPYSGKVWCPKTPNGTWLARRRGTVYFTGNSKCRSVNWAAERARGKVLAILDADAYLDARVVQRCADNIISALKDNRRLWYVPYRKLHRLNEEFTVRLLDDDPALPYSISSPPDPGWLEPGTNTAVNYGYLYGAMAMIMPTEAFFTVGGMDGRFMGWGGEDVSFLKSLDTLYGLHEVTYNDILHLWHLRPGHDWKTRLWIGQGAGLTNSRLSQRYSVASGEPEWMRGVVDERIQAMPLSQSYLRRLRKS